MKARDPRIVLFVFAVVALAGCGDLASGETVASGGGGEGSSGGESASNEGGGDGDGDEDEAPPTEAERAAGAHVAVVQTLDPARRAEVVGLVDVHEPTGRESLGLADLKAVAAKIGAVALTSIEVHPPAPGENITHFSGMAIRYNDLLQGRSYDTLGEIDVDASMMHEDDAFAEVQRRARQMHADLLLNVHFSHGDGTQPLHVFATAIRFH